MLWQIFRFISKTSTIKFSNKRMIRFTFLTDSSRFLGVLLQGLTESNWKWPWYWFCSLFLFHQLICCSISNLGLLLRLQPNSTYVSHCVFIWMPSDDIGSVNPAKCLGFFEPRISQIFPCEISQLKRNTQAIKTYWDISMNHRT